MTKFERCTYGSPAATAADPALYFQLAPVPMFVYDIDSLDFLAANQMALDCYGYSHEELLRLKVTQIRPEEHVREFQTMVERVRLSEVPVRTRSRHRTSDGRVLDVEITSAPLPNEGRRTRLVVVRERSEARQSAAIVPLTPRLDSGQVEELGQALATHQFVVHYQPLYASDSSMITGVEALVRWQHPERGLLYPDEFIALAEESRLILPLGLLVLRQACRQVRDWQLKGHPQLRLAVNLSATQFQQPELIATIDAILAETGLPPSKLEIEITETVALRNALLTMETLRSLRERGITIAVDDFGVGQSSLIYLKQFPITTVKIDRAFMRDVPRDASDAAIVSAVIDLSHKLRLRVVAEGVESDEQLAFLRRQRCDEVQGFLFSPARSSREIEELLGTCTPR